MRGRDLEGREGRYTHVSEGYNIEAEEFILNMYA